jgi:hypothetical protein
VPRTFGWSGGLCRDTRGSDRLIATTCPGDTATMHYFISVAHTVTLKFGHVFNGAVGMTADGRSHEFVITASPAEMHRCQQTNGTNEAIGAAECSAVNKSTHVCFHPLPTPDRAPDQPEAGVGDHGSTD